MFDATLQILQIVIETTQDGVIQLVLFVGFALPVGNGQAMPVPAGIVRVPLNKAAALKHGQELVDAANDLPDAPKESGIVIASSLNGVDEAASAAARFRAA
jgi:hypothetical protein